VSRRIILLRHAQTAGKQAGQRDYDRSLTKEGEAQAMKTGQQLIRNTSTPDFVLSSSAQRARRTALLVMETTRLSTASCRFDDALYEADGDTWLTSIREIPAQVNTLLCVGHNPVLDWLASMLAGRPVDLAPGEFVVLESAAHAWSAFDENIREVSTVLHTG